MEKLVLTSNEIYALAYVMKARRINSSYVAFVDRTGNDDLWLSGITNQLVSEGLITENFSGELSADSSVEKLLNPIFYSDKESSLEIITVGENESNLTYRFHYRDNQIVMTKTVDGKFEISFITMDDIAQIIESVLLDSYEAETAPADIVFDKSNISRFIIVKNTDLQYKNEVSAFVENDGVVYAGGVDNVICSISRNDFIGKVKKIISEV